jgi:hypothetical protein
VTRSPWAQAPASPKGNGQPKGETGETTAGYFRKVFQEHPRLLSGRSNAQLLQRWLADHPDHTEVPQSVKYSLANLKSVLRKKRRKTKAKVENTPEAGSTQVPVAANRPKRPALEALEEQIDECLTFAKHHDREGLHEVIRILRRARNEVVWKLGQ